MRRRLGVLALACLLLCGCAALEDPIQEEETYLPPQAAQPLEPVLPEAFALPVLALQPLNPLRCPDGMNLAVSSLLYEGLFRLDEQLEPQALLCDTWSYDAQTLSYTLTLRRNVTFSDGSALTAADVAASLKAAAASQRYGVRLGAVRSVSASGQETVRIRLNAAHSALPSLLDVPIFKAGTEGRDVPTGTGPYRYDPERSALTANSLWHGGTALPVEQIALAATADGEAMLYRLQAREVQALAADLTGSEGVRLSGGSRSVDADTTLMQYVGVNVQRVEAAALRRCLSLGIGRERLAGTLLSGHARGAQFPVSPVSPLYPQTLEQEDSPAAFAAAVSALSVPLPETPLRLVVNGENPFKVSAARQIAENFSAAGVATEVDVLEWDAFQSALEQGDFDLYYGEVRLGADWDLTALLGTGGAVNYTGWSDEQCDALLQDALDAADRPAAMLALCRYLRQEAPLLPVCFKKTSVLYDPEVLEGLVPTAAEPFSAFPGCTVRLREG